jgi:hypothetical protein
MEDLSCLLAPTFTATRDAHGRFEDQQHEEGRGEDEQERSEVLPEGLRHLG